jgi:cytochrome c-type biogenesis protein CcmH
MAPRARPHLTVVAIAVLASGALLSSPSRAVEPGEMLADPALEARARALSAELRCLVCQNQSIDDSNAPLARDLRLLVRERLVAGDSDTAVRRFVVDRYGSFVLLKPPVTVGTLLLWATPLLMLLGVAAMVWPALKRRRPSLASHGSSPLSADEKKRLDDLLTHDHASAPPDDRPSR